MKASITVLLSDGHTLPREGIKAIFPLCGVVRRWNWKDQTGSPLRPGQKRGRVLISLSNSIQPERPLQICGDPKCV
jgi:hypothetical protein